jgi:regulator of sigma E protease
LVERFSFGFGPRLFGVKIGETDYCVSAILVGGYVKMAGHEDVPGSDESEKVPEERKFTSKTIPQRAGIFVAGPLMNLVLGFVVFIGLMMVGQEVEEFFLDTRIGAVEKGSPAETAGLKPNDRVLSINGKRVTKWQELVMAALVNAEREMTYQVERDGRTMEFRVWSRDFDGRGQPRAGIAPFVPAMIGEPTEGKPAHAAGLQKGDTIVSINGVPVGTSETRVMTRESIGKPLEYEIERDGTRFKTVITPAGVGEIDPAQMVLAKGRVLAINKDFGKEKGILFGDEVRFISNEAVEPDEVEKMILNSPNAKLVFRMYRPPFRLFRIIPLGAAMEYSVEIETQQRGMIGVPLWPSRDVPMPKVLVRYNVIKAIPQGIAEGWSAFSTSLQSVKLILTRRVSTKALGGPVLIYQMTQDAAREGIGWLVKLVGVISIYFCIFNLLPLPVLDGGHVALLIVEKIRKRPVDEKVQEVLQYVGIALFITLFLFITYNDVLRLIARRFVQ